MGPGIQRDTIGKRVVGILVECFLGLRSRSLNFSSILGKNPDSMKDNKTKNRHSHDDCYDAVEANDLDSRYRNEFSTSNVCAILNLYNNFSYSQDKFGIWRISLLWQGESLDSSYLARYSQMKNINS